MKFVAHRGLSSLYYQNSKEAFEKAGEENFFYGVETDIRLTKDRKWVCSHDNDPFRNKSLLVSEMLLEDTLKEPLSEKKKGAATMTGEMYLCTLEDYLLVMKKHNMMPFIEIKCKADNEALEDLVEIVEGIVGDQATYICFTISYLEYILKLRPKANVQGLCKFNFTARLCLKKGLHIDQLLYTLRRKTLKLAHSMGKEVNIWTLVSLKQARKFIDMGVDYITTDYSFKGQIKSTLKDG